MLSVKVDKNYLVSLSAIQLEQLDNLSFMGSKTCRQFGGSLEKTLGMPVAAWAQENAGEQIKLQISSSTGISILNMLKDVSQNNYSLPNFPNMAQEAQALLPLFEQARLDHKHRPAIEVI